MPNNQTNTAADLRWRALGRLLRREGGEVDEIKAHGIRALFASDLSLSHAEACALVEATQAYGRKHGLRWTGRVSPEGAPQLITFMAPAG